MLRRRGQALALCDFRLDDAHALVDLDAPVVLLREGMRPSRVATRRRDTTQADARGLFHRHPGAAGLRWWSTIESAWINWTLFVERLGEGALEHGRPRVLSLGEPLVEEAAGLLGMR